MREFFNLFKYEYIIKRGFIIKGTILGALAVFTIVLNKLFNMQLSNVAIISSALGIYFIAAIIEISTELSKEGGRLLFLAPVKGGSYLLYKFISFAITQILIMGTIIISTLITTKDINVCGALFNISVPIIFGTVLAFMVISCMITIVASYLDSVFLIIVTTILGTFIFMTVGEIIVSIISNLLPYFYMIINNIKIGIVPLILSIIILIILNIVAAKHFNNKLDIN